LAFISFGAKSGLKMKIYLAAGFRINSLKMRISAAETSAEKSKMKLLMNCRGSWKPGLVSNQLIS